MAYESLIEDTEIVQGDSSDIFLFTIDNTELPADYEGSFCILTDYGTTPLVSRNLPRNDGSEGFVANSQFVFQLRPSETAILEPGVKYIVAVEIRNPTLYYNEEVAQFKVKIKPQGVV